MQIDEFWRYVDQSGGAGACWPWTRAVNSTGYGSLWVDGRSLTASRVAYKLAYGNIPRGPGYHGFVVRHQCDNRLCCNPNHLVIGTQKQNNEDRDKRNRIKNRTKGENSHLSRLSEQDVLAIRSLSKDMSLSAIAKIYGCSKSGIAHVVSRRAWDWLSDTPLGDAAMERAGR